MFTEYGISIGDNVKCFNKTIGIVKSFNWPMLTIDWDGISMEIHIANICEINGLSVEPMVDKLVFK